MLVKSIDPTDVVIVYAVNPIPVAKLIACTVFALAVTVNEDKRPELAPCSRLITSLLPALRINVVFNPLIPIYNCPVPLTPIFPCVAVKLIPAPAAITWILAVDAINVPAVLMIDPAVEVMLTAPAAALVMTALAPKFTLRPALNVMIPEEEVRLDATVMSPPEVVEVRLMAPALVTVELI